MKCVLFDGRIQILAMSLKISCFWWMLRKKLSQSLYLTDLNEFLMICMYVCCSVNVKKSEFQMDKQLSTHKFDFKRWW